MNDAINKYCVGCGLCEAKGKAILQADRKGFLHPISCDDEWLKKVCPSSGIHTSQISKEDIWGNCLNVFYGWSTCNHIRKLASSGGVTTSLCCYLLDKGLVDGIIQTSFCQDNPTKTITTINCSAEEVIACSGSRYSISSPLRIFNEIDPNKRYAFVGKPCDVVALHNFCLLEPEYKRIIPYVLSFFCMGLPSECAQMNLLQQLGCKPHKLTALRYRGDGWPGLTKAEDNNGNIYQMDYNTSWGKILGRDLMPMCRFCEDGIGEFADVSSADGWYLDENSKPCFNESEGRNVVFARTKTGALLLQNAYNDGYVSIQKFDDYKKVLPLIQYAQFERRASMYSRILALKFLRLPYPNYNRAVMVSHKKMIPIKKRLNYFRGIIKRRKIL